VRSCGEPADDEAGPLHLGSAHACEEAPREDPV